MAWNSKFISLGTESNETGLSFLGSLLLRKFPTHAVLFCCKALNNLYYIYKKALLGLMFLRYTHSSSSYSYSGTVLYTLPTCNCVLCNFRYYFSGLVLVLQNTMATCPLRSFLCRAIFLKQLYPYHRIGGKLHHSCCNIYASCYSISHRADGNTYHAWCLTFYLSLLFYIRMILIARTQEIVCGLVLWFRSRIGNLGIRSLGCSRGHGLTQSIGHTSCQLGLFFCGLA